MLTLTTASAGSGKTYRLAQDYIRLALDPNNPRAFASILAVTFTKKATAEIKERILAQLKAMAEGRMELPVQSPRHTPALAGRVHRAILEHYDDFAVLTLDSFFQKIIRAFALELDLPGNYRIQLDTEEVKELAVERLLGRDGSRPEVRPLLRRMVQEQLEDGGKWNVRGRIAGFADQLFKSSFAHHEPELEAQHGLVSDMVLSEIRAEYKELNQGLEAAVRQYEALIVEAEQAYGSDLLAAKVRGMLAKMEDKPWEFADDQKTKYVQEMLHDSLEVGNYFTKASLKKYGGIAPGIAERLGGAIADVAAYLQRNRSRYTTLHLLYKKLPDSLLVSALSHELKQIREERNLFLLYQQALFLKRVTERSSTPFIYDKIGLRLKHFLIDEMQDTSRDQWQALRPLIENSLGTGEENLVVGDVKQAIYRWRDGDATLMLGGIAHDLPAGTVKADVLPYNYRSLGRVVDFNNAVVEQLPHLARNAVAQAPELERLPERVRDQILVESGLLERAFEMGTQQVPPALAHRLGQGYVRLEFWPQAPRFAPRKEEGEEAEPDEAQVRLRAWLEEVYALGYAPGDVCILVRTKTQGARVAQILQDAEAAGDARFAFSSADSLAVDQASVVRFLVAVGRVLASSKDVLSMVAAVHEYHIYLKPLMRRETEPDTEEAAVAVSELLSYAWKGGDETPPLARFFTLLPKGLEDAWQDVGVLGASAAMQALAGICGLAEVESEQGYLLSFLESAHTYDRDQGGALAGFLAWWDQRGHKLRIDMPPTRDRIQLQTIHASKGLEYPVVLVPFADWKLDQSHQQKEILWLKTEPERYHGVALGAFEYDRKLRASDFAGAAFSEQIARALDALNLAYVAFTRAARMLYIGARMPFETFKRGEREASSLSDLLYQLAETGAAEAQRMEAPERVSEAYAWGAPVAAEDSKLAGEPAGRIRLRFPVPRPKPAVAPAASVSLETGLMENTEVLARLLREATPDGRPDERTAQALLADGAVTQAQLDQQKEALMQRTTDPALAPLWGSRHDRLLLAPTLVGPDGATVSPDRALLKKEGGAVLAQVVLGQAEADAGRAILGKSARIFGQMGRPVLAALLIYLQPFGVEQIAPNAEG